MDSETTVGGYALHPACGMLPMMTDEAIAELAEDIRRHGQQQPIWLYRGQLLDGRNRLEACLLAGVTPEVREWDGDDPVRWALSLNFHRRHLTDGQKAVVGARAEHLLAEREAASRASAERDAEPAPAMPRVSDVRPEDVKRARSAAAVLVNVSERAIAKGRDLLERAVPALVDAVERGAVPMAAATTIASLARDEQVRVVEAGDAAVRDEARRIRKERSDGKPTVPGALSRLEAALPALRLDKSPDGRWRFEGSSPDLDHPIVTEGRSAREALASACQRLDRLDLD